MAPTCSTGMSSGSAAVVVSGVIGLGLGCLGVRRGKGRVRLGDEFLDLLVDQQQRGGRAVPGIVEGDTKFGAVGNAGRCHAHVTWTKRAAANLHATGKRRQ